MSVGAESEDLQVNPASFTNRSFIFSAVRGHIGNHAVGNMNTLTPEIHMREEVLLHELVVGSRMGGVEVDVFVQVEGGCLTKIESILPVHPG